MTKAVALVVQRYGEDLVGGAEAHARTLAERLHSQLGWKIDVLTTCAQSYKTWSNHYPSGLCIINGIRVHRFATVCSRAPFFSAISRIIFKLLRLQFVKSISILKQILEWLWIIAQGPYCPSLVQHLKRNHQNYDFTIFFTYLYYPTISGLRIPNIKTIFIPTAHDEPALYFDSTRQSFINAKLIFANSVTEAALIEKILPTAQNVSIVGLGIETNSIQRQQNKANYLLYLGRISKGKNVDTLIKWFIEMRLNCKLILAGVREEGISWPDDAPVEYLGILNDTEKMSVIAKARCLINPSPLESLSLIVLEAIAASVPVLVNRNCEIFEYYEHQMPSVFGYADNNEFESQLGDILARNWTDPAVAKDLEVSRRWVEQRYSWDVVLSKFNDANLETV